jgi:hypothetical protein
MTQIKNWIDSVLADTTLIDWFLPRFENPETPVFFWYRALWDAFQQAAALAWNHVLTLLLGILVTFVVSVLAYNWYWTRHTVGRAEPRRVLPGIVGVVLAVSLGFVLIAMSSAFDLYDAQRTRAEAALATADDRPGDTIRPERFE